MPVSYISAECEGLLPAQVATEACETEMVRYEPDSSLHLLRSATMTRTLRSVVRRRTDVYFEKTEDPKSLELLVAFEARQYTFLRSVVGATKLSSTS